jgi:hypothetical protein
MGEKALGVGACCAIDKKLKATGYPTQQSGVPCP